MYCIPRLSLPRRPHTLATRMITITRPSPKVLILAIESSADDSCASVIAEPNTILSSVVIKQNHSSYGGIHPLIAQRMHQSNVPTAIARALSEAGVDLGSITAVAYTRGPGMMACLTVGAIAAKTIASVLTLPLIGVHHMVRWFFDPSLTLWSSWLSADCSLVFQASPCFNTISHWSGSSNVPLLDSPR